MALNLIDEVSSEELPEVSVRLTKGVDWADARAMIDTGSGVSLFDTELLDDFALLASSRADRSVNVIGVGGVVRRVPFWRMEVSVVPLLRPVPLFVGFLPGLGKSTGNLLGRDFLEHVHFGLAHADRRLYLGVAGA